MANTKHTNKTHIHTAEKYRADENTPRSATQKILLASFHRKQNDTDR